MQKLLGFNLHSKNARRLLVMQDQVFFSLANFILTVVLARHYSEVEFAGYGIGLSIALMLQGVVRQVFVVHNSLLAPEVLRKRAKKVLGQQVVMWGAILTVEVLVLLALFAFGVEGVAKAAAYGTFVCSLIYAQLDFDRMVFIKHERYFDTLVLSFLFLVLTGSLFFLVPMLSISFEGTMGLICLYAAVKSSWLLKVVGGADMFWGSRLALRDLKRYFGAAVLGTLGYSGYNHFPLFILGVVAAPIQAAAFVAMRGLIQPLQVVVRSFDLIDKNSFHQESGGTAAGMRRVLLRQLSTYAIFCVLALVGAMLLGEWVVELVYGEKYAAYTHILIGWVVIFSMLALGFPLESAIVRKGRLNAYNRFRIVSGGVGVLAALILCPLFGAMGAVAACLVGWVVSMGFAVWLVRDILKA